MATNRQIETLQEEFPEMTTSMLVDVLKNYGNNAQNAKKALKGFSDTQQADKERKIKELEEMFKDKLPREFIIKTLEDAAYDVDVAILPLFNKCEENTQAAKKREETERKKKREEEDSRRRKREMERQVQHLMEAFKNIPQSKVQEVLDANEGDIEETTVQLLGLVQQEEDEAKAKQKAEEERRRREEEEKKKAEDQNRDIKINALKGQFLELSEAEVITVLESCKWDIKKAYGELLNYSINKKKKDLKDLFQSCGENEILAILEAHAFDKMKAAKDLMTKREARRMAEENRIKEEFQKQEETKKQEEPPKPSTNVMEKSIIMGEMLEAEVAASQIFLKKEEERKKKEEHEEAKQQFKKNLERVIEDQVRWNNNMPGLVPPPLPKQIDQMVAKRNAPDVEQSAPAQSPQPDQPAPGSDSKILEESKCTVEMTAQPQLVDTGNTVNVEWAIASGLSSNRDWIGLFALDKANKEYVTYQWTGKQLSKGTLSFSAPAMGEYEFRYFPNGSYQHISRSNKIRVGPQFEVVAVLDKANNKMIAKWKQISGNSYPKAWIGLFEKSQTNNNNFMSYQSVGKSNEIAFPAPFKPREYEFRFFANSYVDIVRSNAILIEGSDSMTATYNNGNLTVKLNVVSVDPYYESAWLGVYFTHEGDNRQWRRYKYLASRTDDVQFNGPKTPGEYEVRMFANKTYDLILKSNKFVIPFPGSK